MKIEVYDIDGNLVETYERPECFGKLTDDANCYMTCPYLDECEDATNDMNEVFCERCGDSVEDGGRHVKNEKTGELEFICDYCYYSENEENEIHSDEGA